MRYEIIDTHTQRRVGRIWVNRHAIQIEAERLDWAYGAVRYIVQAVK